MPRQLRRHAAVSLTVEGSNLLRTRTLAYYATPHSPNGWNIDDRQISTGARFHF
ncbi:MAG TPA: hypothetical protein VGC28_06715 [Sphingomonas sp.]